ncbi:hypothetical protein N9790_04705 [Gammaproteobacteria bacterium]|nr:hypothetical protein [Gammaproteobacteria bacterium]
MGFPTMNTFNPDNVEQRILHWCSGPDDDVTAFIYNDTVYDKFINVSAQTRASYGVWSTQDYSYLYFCDGGVRVDWKIVPTNELIKKDSVRIAQEKQKLELQIAEARAVVDAREAQTVSEEFYIDGLIIIHTQYKGADCTSGGDYTIQIKGDIGPDSSFALEELLRRSPNCLGRNREIRSRTSVELESLGGYLNDGYLMGRAFRSHEIKTIITDNSICASSCAVAYLGGVERLMENDSIIMLHSPYLPGLNALGERVADCDLGSETTTELLNYYQEMTSKEQGERLFDRTMNYCSTQDGWVLRGSASAELFGVATKI